MNDNETKRLAHAINELRPDWPISSLTNFIGRDLARRTYRDAAVMLVWVAVDTKPDGTPASNTPRRVLEAGPWHRAVLAEDPSQNTATAPKRHEQCTTCGRHLGACICGEQTSRPSQRGDAAAGAAAARAALHKTTTEETADV